MSDTVVWHDVECGAYRADLPVWRRLAAAAGGGQLLDVGAGTGRVTLDLAARGRSVIALERDGELAAELERRAAGLPVEVICADACDFALERRVALCIVPMQTVQLLEDRAAFLRCARACLEGGGLLALAILGSDLQPFEVELPADVAQHGGVSYASAPTALRQTHDTVVLERRRRASSEDGTRETLDVIELRRLAPETLITEGQAAGLLAREPIAIAPTAQHAGSVIVCLEAPR
ncbi:MAG TPA: class I SAM-dependent methyltransferase [Solirubrobacteraceae bacterium]|nr:class I SAM-dependent methyltransferase [Solirubrobacteraceae bacterium]